MRLLWASLIWLGTLTSLAHAAGFAEMAAMAPACGVECITQVLPSSPCSMTDMECLCTNQQFAAATQACVAKACSMKEALDLMRVQNTGCGVPVQSQQTRFKVHAIVSCVMAEIAIILRMYSKFKVTCKVGLDDYFILVAAVATVPYLYVHCTLADTGFGLNIWDVYPYERLYKVLKLFWIDQILYSVHLYSVKLSILAFLLSIFPAQGFKRITYGVAIFVILNGIAVFLTTAMQCLPASFNWTSWDGEHVGKCNNLNLQTYIFGGLNMACDILILVLPLRELYHLQVKSRQRIQLFIMFSLGIIVTVFSLIRLPYLVTLGITSNPTWDYVEVTIWSIWETELGMVCASLPAIRHLFKVLFPEVMATIGSKFSSYARSGAKSGAESGNWTGSRGTKSGTRPNNDTKGFQELDELSLMGKNEHNVTVQAA